MARTVGIPSARDSFVNEASADTNYSGSASMTLNGNSAGVARRYAYVGLPVDLPRTAEIVSATLKLRLRGTWSGGPHTVTARRITGAWTESTVTWNNAPATTATNAATAAVTAGADGDLLSIDVTNMIQDVVDGGAYRGIRLSLDTSGNKTLYTSEHQTPTQRPKLVIEYSVPPDAPERLAPDDGTGVTSASPRLRWNYESSMENEDQAHSQVVIATSEANLNAGTYVYDSGWVANTDESYLLSVNEVQTLDFNNIGAGDTFKLTHNAVESAMVTYSSDMSTDIDTALEALASIDTVTVTKVSTSVYTVEFTGSSAATDMGAITITSQVGFTATGVTETVKGGYTMSSGTTYWWKVRVKNDSGVISDYSENASLAYWSTGTLTITSPAADNDDVDDYTPVMAWTFTGRTQAFTQAFVYKLVGTEYKLKYQGKKRANTATSWTIPANVVKTVGGKYKFTLRVWDNKDRARGGYVEQSRIFDFDPSTAVTAPASLTATVDGPKVHLEWTRASAPDGWVVLVDGEIAKTTDDGASWLKTGTTYQTDWYGGLEGTTYTITVRAKTDGVGVSTAASTTATPAYVGLWLVHPDEAIEVQLAGQANVEMRMTESGQTLYPIDRRDPVRITGEVRGYEGRVTGTLVQFSSSGDTANTALSNLETLLGTYAVSGDLRLIAGQKNMPVVVGNLSMAEGPAGDQRYDAGFDFWQVDEFDVEEE